MSETGAPSSAAQLLQQGLFHHQRGELAPAMDRYTEVLRNDPHNVDALYYCAVIACQEDQLDQGIALARRALEHGSPQARIHNLIGKALERQKQPLEAVKSYDAAIALDPEFAEAHGNRAGLLAEAGLAAEALKGFERALALNPEAAPDWINRGALLHELGRHDEALACFDKALVLVPDNPTIMMNRANVQTSLDRFDEAEAGYDQVIRHNPKQHLAYAHKGLVAKLRGRFGEARELMTKAHRMNEKDPDAAFGLGRLMLLMGDWRTGWPLFEARGGLAKPTYTPLDHPRWRGEAPGDFRLVLLGEQGLDDAIQFGRYASLLAGRGHDVTLVTRPQLAPLLRTLPGIEQVVTDVAELSNDKRKILWLPLLSTMGLLHLTPDTVPVQEPYLRAEPERVAAFAERLGPGRKVGVYWQGMTRAGTAPLDALAPLADVPGLRLISLQKQPGAREIAQAPFGGKIEQLLDAADFSAEGLLDTAALIANLDAVVGIDSVPAHLAGALGKPVLLALPLVPDWRWLLNRDDTPWYPTMRLYRQPAAGDWASVFARIATDLRALAPSSQG